MPPDALELSQLCHNVVAVGVEERLRIRIRELEVPGARGMGPGELRCKAYVGPMCALEDAPEGKPDKTRLKDVRLELANGAAAAEVDVGVPSPEEVWGIRVKFYHRPASALFTQEKVAEAVETVPRAASRAALKAGEGRPKAGVYEGSVSLEVLRVIPRSALAALKDAAGRVLVNAVKVGAKADDIEDLCKGIQELGEETLLEPGAAQALELAAGAGKADVVERLLAAGVLPTTAAARAAEEAGTPQSVALAKELLMRCSQPAGPPVPLLARALDERLPLLAERVLDEDPTALAALPAEGGNAARKAHAAGAWTVLAALLARGDPTPISPKGLLDYALRVGHVRLARACLARSEGVESMQVAINTCLSNGRIEIVREALEAQWRARNSQWSEGPGPPLLAFECGLADEPAECGVCFEPLYKGPGAFLNEKGFRVCLHFCCLNCAEHVQDEAAERGRVWRARRDPRIPQPPGPVCPFCRAAFHRAARFTDPTVDPRSFFRLACVPGAEEEVDRLRLPEKIALGALCALLPINAVSFAPRLAQELWPAWCAEAASASGARRTPGNNPDCLTEKEFLRPGGMLAWISDHLLERKVESQRGAPPRLQDNPGLWFRHFDYDGKGVLTKPELLRGIAKAYDVAVLASPKTPVRRARSVGVQRLRDIVAAIWDESRWKDGVPLSEFICRAGLAERLLMALPGESSPKSGSMSRARTLLSVEEALERARAADLQVREEDELRAQERAEKERQAAAAMPPPRPARPPSQAGPQGDPQRAGATLLLASLLEAAREGNRGVTLPAIRIQCPFCGAVNQARAAAGHRVICGGCRSFFAVPTGAGTAMPGGGPGAAAPHRGPQR